MGAEGMAAAPRLGRAPFPTGGEGTPATPAQRAGSGLWHGKVSAALQQMGVGDTRCGFMLCEVGPQPEPG